MPVTPIRLLELPQQPRGSTDSQETTRASTNEPIIVKYTLPRETREALSQHISDLRESPKSDITLYGPAYHPRKSHK